MRKNLMNWMVVIALAFCAKVLSWADEMKLDASLLTQGAYVNGDEQKFRENLQVNDRMTAGLQSLSLSKELGKVKLDMEGRALYEQDYGLNLSLKRDENAYLKVKVDSNRHFYDSSNVYYFNSANVTNPSKELDKKLKTDRNNYSSEFGFSLTNTKIYFGIQRDEKRGDENLYWGGWIRDGASNIWIHWTNPLERRLDYNTNRFYAGVNQSLLGFDISLRQDVEKVYGQALHTESGYRRDQATKVHDRTYRSDTDHITRTTRFGFDGDVIKSKLNLGMEYKYSRTDNLNNYDSDAVKPTGALQYDEHALNFLKNEHDGLRYLHSIKTTLTLTAFDPITPFVGVLYENGEEKNNSIRRETGSNGGSGDDNPNTVDEQWVFGTNNREVALNTNAGVSLSLVPKTKINLQFDNEDSDITYLWSADFQRRWFGTGNSASTTGDWNWDADTIYKRKIYSASLRTQPYLWLTGYAKYKFTDQTVSVVERSDYMENKLGDPEYGWPATNPRTDLYYPGRIGDWKKPTQEVSASLSITPCPYTVFRPKFDMISSMIEVANESVQEISKFESKVYGLSLDLLTPVSGLTSTWGVSRRNSLTETLAATTSNSVSKNPMTGATDTSYWGGRIGAFNNDVLAMDGQVNYRTGGWAINLNGGRTEGQGNFATLYWWTGGQIEFELMQNLSSKLKIAHYDYSEENNGSINNYNAKVVALSLAAKF